MLVTGGAGYIGSVLVPTLLASGHQVTALDSFLFGQTSLLECVHDPRLRVVRGDARDARLLEAELEGVDWIVPLACLTDAELLARDPTEAESVTLDGIDRLLELRSDSQWIAYPGAYSGYAGAEAGIRDEESPRRPVSLYGRLVVEAERRVLQAGHSIALRLASAFGVSPRMRLDLRVNDFTYRAVTGSPLVVSHPGARRGAVHVRDVARAFLHAMDHAQAMCGQAYNVGIPDANPSVRELCEQIRRHVPGWAWSETPAEGETDPRHSIVSCAKLAATGFRTAVSLDRGIAELVRGYQILRRAQPQG